MKRVVTFVEMVDSIPSGAKFIGHQIINVPTGETEEQKSHRIIHGDQEGMVPANTQPLRLFFYEVEESDWQKLIDSDFHNKSIPMRINEFLTKYPYKKGK